MLLGARDRAVDGVPTGQIRAIDALGRLSGGSRRGVEQRPGSVSNSHDGNTCLVGPDETPSSGFSQR